MRTNAPSGIRVVGVDENGRRVASAPVRHGEHPEALLAEHGLEGTPTAAVVAADGALELRYAVSSLDGIPESRATDARHVRRDADVAPDEPTEPHQRVAAYAVVLGQTGVLLTQFNSQTGIPGQWGLPGGGLDVGESPTEGVHREVWEETGQRIELGPLLTVQSQHWVGRAPTGVVEDFHAVRLVYRASCAEPAPIVIHDVGGTTSDARWVPLTEVAALPMTASWRGLVDALSTAAEGAPSHD